MLKQIRDFSIGKEHVFQDINRELLYRNRLVKSVYFLLLLISSFFLNVLVFYLNMTGKLNGTFAINVIQVYLVGAVIIGFIVFPYHHSHYGFNLNRLKFNLLTAIPIGLFGIAVSATIRYFMYKAGTEEWGFYFDPFVFAVRFFTYILFSFCQEAIIKGLLQSYFIGVFEKLKFGKILAIIVASTVFAQYHILYGLTLVAATFVFSFITGLYYEKSRSLVGVTIIHFMAGAGIFFFSKLY